VARPQWWDFPEQQLATAGQLCFGSASNQPAAQRQGCEFGEEKIQVKSRTSLCTVLLHCAFLIAAAWLLTGTAMAAGPKHTILYSFTGLSDGGSPIAGLILDSTGALYGTGESGGNYNSCDEGGACGVVFKLAPPLQNGGAWTESVLYDFQYQDPYPPNSNLGFDQAGNLYGATAGGSTAVYQLTELDGSWSLNPIYRAGDGTIATPILDQKSNLYTTVEFDSTNPNGLVLELSPQLNGSWAQTTLYAFAGGNDGSAPKGGVIADKAGNLYGTTVGGGGNSQCGTVFQLTQVNGGWTETVLHSFTGSDGCYPYAGVIVDAKGNLYGTTSNGGAGVCNNKCGVVFELSPPEVKGGAWTESFLLLFNNTDGANPLAALAIDSTGALYGTTNLGGNGPCEPKGAGCGTVFRLTPPSKPGGAWSQIFYSFQGPDGAKPYGNVLLDQSKGVLYGTTLEGGANGYGTVFQFTR
jgi:uncharacterized repeat protein (TIGR03803 family)